MQRFLRNTNITKRFRNKNNFKTNDIVTFLMNLDLKPIYHYPTSDTYEFSHHSKPYILKLAKHKRNLYGNYESDINCYVSKKMQQQIIPYLYVQYKEILLFSNNMVIFVYEKLGYEIWNIMDSSDINKIKSVFLQILVGLWFINHKAKLFHGDICGRPDRPHLRNVMYNKTSIKERTFKLNSYNITINLHQIDLKFIDFGTSLFTNQNIKKKNKKYNVFFHNFLYHSVFSSLKIKSELMYAISCLLRYYKIEDKTKLYDFFKTIKHRCTEKQHSADVEQIDLELIKYMNQSFESFMKSFSPNFPRMKQTTYNE